MNQIKVLIVEDDYLTGENIKMYLENSGYSVPSIAVSGEDAIDLAEEHSPDIVLMDIILDGEMDGILAAEHIYKTLNIPIVFLTSHTDENTLNRAKIAEPFGYIAKPFEEKQLLVAVEMALYKDRTSKERKKLIEDLTQEVSVRKKTEKALRNALEKSQQHEYEISALLKATRELLKYTSFNESARFIFGSCKDLIGATAGYVALLSSDGEEN